MATKAQISDTQLEDAARLRALFAAHARLSQAEFGAEYEIGVQGMVWQYLNAKRPLNIDACVKFARGLGITIDQISPTIAQQIKDAWRLTDTSLQEPTERSARSSASRLDTARAVLASVQAGGEEAANDPGFVEIRRAAVRVSAGVRGFTADIVGSEFNGSIYLPRAVIEKHHYSVNALVATTVTGDSMAPRIGEHDVLLLNTADTDKKAGHVYGVNHDGQFLVKRLACRHKRWYLDSDNTSYPPVLAEENTFIVGRVVMMVSNEI